MDTKLFREWYAAVRPGKAGMELFSFLGEYPEADKLLSQALAKKKGAAWIIYQLKAAGALVPLPQAQPEEYPQAPKGLASPVFAPAQTETSDDEALERENVSPKSKFEFLKKIEKRWYWIGGGVIFLILLALIGYFVFAGGSSTQDQYDFESQPSLAEPAPTYEPAPLEAPPIAPPPNPLNFKGSIDSRGFLGKVQSLIFVVGLGILATLIGDIVYRQQWWDGVTAILVAAVSIIVVFPIGTVWWIGLFLFLLELYLVWFAAFQGGQDYSPLAAYFLLVGVFGGLMATRIGAIQNIFTGMSVLTVPTIISLGYYFQTMNFASLAFPLVVYLFILIGFVMTVVECVRPSGEDRSSRWGSLVSGGVGLIFYFVFLHAVGLVPWVCFMIALLISAGGSAALRSQPAKQFVAPVWGVRSPFDGAMLLAALILLLLVIFGQQWWLIGVI